MVTIVEDHSKKIPAVTSLYIKLDTYNKLLFDKPNEHKTLNIDGVYSSL